jgi:hypothetical protein
MGKESTPAELLEEDGFAFHDGHAGEASDVAEAEDGGAVGDDGAHIALEGVVIREVGVGLDLLAGSATPGV